MEGDHHLNPETLAHRRNPLVITIVIVKFFSLFVIFFLSGFHVRSVCLRLLSMIWLRYFGAWINSLGIHPQYLVFLLRYWILIHDLSSSNTPNPSMRIPSHNNHGLQERHPPRRQHFWRIQSICPLPRTTYPDGDRLATTTGQTPGEGQSWTRNSHHQSRYRGTWTRGGNTGQLSAAHADKSSARGATTSHWVRWQETQVNSSPEVN